MQLISILQKKKNKWNLEWDIYYSAEELLSARENNNMNYDLFIFDIMMSDLNGMELAEIISEEDKEAFFIFMTSYDEYAICAINSIVNLAGYLIKPVNQKSFENALENYTKKKYGVSKFRFSFKNDTYQISGDSIIYIERAGRTISIVTDQDIYKSYMKSTDIWNQLDRKNFASPHVSYIVNLKRIIGTRGNEVLLENGSRIPLSRSMKQEFKDCYLEFLGDL